MRKRSPPCSTPGARKVPAIDSAHCKLRMRSTDDGFVRCELRRRTVDTLWGYAEVFVDEAVSEVPARGCGRRSRGTGEPSRSRQTAGHRSSEGRQIGRRGATSPRVLAVRIPATRPQLFQIPAARSQALWLSRWMIPESLGAIDAEGLRRNRLSMRGLPCDRVDPRRQLVRDQLKRA